MPTFHDSTITSARSPEETLLHLDSLGIEWHITEEGDLMVKSWVVVARGFLNPDEVAAVRLGRPAPREASALQWVSQNLDALRIRYPGQWIAVVQDQVVGNAAVLPTLLEQLRDAGVDRPFITQIPAGEIVWSTAYAG